MYSACNPVVKAVAHLPSLLEDKTLGRCQEMCQGYNSQVGCKQECQTCKVKVVLSAAFFLLWLFED